MYDDPSEQVGRTFSDLLYAVRYWMLGATLLIVIVAAMILLRPSPDGILEILSEYYPLILVGLIVWIIFWYIARIATFNLLTVPSKEILVVDYERLTGMIVSIPSPVFMLFKTSGKSLCFRWRNGTEFYFARNIDWDNMTIDFGWPHDISIDEAAVLLSSMQAREKDYENAKKENIVLRRIPVVIGADLAKPAVNAFLNDLSGALCLDNLDIDRYVGEIDPLKSLYDLEKRELKSQEISAEDMDIEFDGEDEDERV